MATPRRRLGVVLGFVLAAYFAALATLPFAHHDLVCHLKSTTHCTVCHVGTSGDQSSVRPSPARVTLADAGQAHSAPQTAVGSCVLSPSAGRAPPTL